MKDLIIIGAGPAGITAGIYAACYRMDAVIIGKLPGGEMLSATHILNYPGFPPLTGTDLTDHMVKQLNALGHVINEAMVTAIDKIDGGYRVTTDKNEAFDGKNVIVATGTERRRLNIAGEREMAGKGVFYCATCDSKEVEGKTVCVIGGSNAAVQAAETLTKWAAKVYIIYRGDALRADPVWIEKISKNPKVEIIYKTNIKEIKGSDWVSSIVLDAPYKESIELSLQGVFVEIGGVPGTALLGPLGVKVDDKGFIEIGTDMQTNVPGIYAAGDCTTTGNMLQQISVSVGEGAKATGFAYKTLRAIRPPALWGKMGMK